MFNISHKVLFNEASIILRNKSLLTAYIQVFYCIKKSIIILVMVDFAIPEVVCANIGKTYYISIDFLYDIASNGFAPNMLLTDISINGKVTMK